MLMSMFEHSKNQRIMKLCMPKGFLKQKKKKKKKKKKNEKWILIQV